MEVRSRSDHDLVLPLGVHEDESHAGRRVDALQVELDAGGDERGESLVRKRIVADGGNECDLRAEAGCSERLVRALAARDACERCAGDGLARPRQALAPRHEIEVHRADDGDARAATRGQVLHVSRERAGVRSRRAR